MNILSLFDGISCGQIALNRAEIKYDKYFASEIDKHAIKVTQNNYPNTIQLGDITKWKEWDIDWKSIDLLTAGFPCQAWSVAGKQKGIDDPRGALAITLFELFNFLKENNPNVKFLFENVKMKKQYINYLNNLFGVEPIEINSSLVSAQIRKRLYWTNIENIQLPEDKNILLQDILESGFTERRKSYCLLASSNPSNRPAYIRRYLQKHIGQCKMIENNNLNLENLVTLSCVEYERLQTIPDNYTSCISNPKRYHALGNCWTVDIIAHIFKNLS